MLAIVLVGALACGPQAAAAEVGSPSYPNLGREIVRIVRDEFMDPERAAAWAERNADYAAEARDGAEFALRTNEVLAELETSHTHYYLRGTASYRGLLAIFGESLEVGPVTYDSIGADVSDRHFVRRVLAGGPAAHAGVLRGDRLVAVDGKPYDPVGPFDGKAGTPVELTVERSLGGPTVTLWVTPSRVDPKEEWVTAMDEGARLVSRDGVDVAYVPVPWCVGDEVSALMRDMIAVRFSEANGPEPRDEDRRRPSVGLLGRLRSAPDVRERALDARSAPALEQIGAELDVEQVEDAVDRLVDDLGDRLRPVIEGRHRRHDDAPHLGDLCQDS